MRRITSILFMILALSCTIQSHEKFDHSKWNQLLREYVDEDGLVDYNGIGSEKSFAEYLDEITDADISSLSKDAKLAFYINAYNACVIKNVIDHSPINSPLKVDGFFKKIKFKIAGEELTLDEIEHKRVLKINPVLPHFGLVCAAKSCPKLISFAYTEQNVNEQLKNNAKEFLRNAEKNYLDKKTKTLYLSQIFNWFDSYFKKKYKSVIDFVEKYLPKDDVEFIGNNNVEIEFLNYDWTLNKQ